MPEILMPKGHRSILAKLITLSAEQSEALVRELRAEPQARSLTELAERIATPTRLSKDDAQSVIRMLSSMYEAMVRFDETPERFAGLAIQAAKELPDGILSENVDWDAAQRLIVEVLNSEQSLGVSSKTLGVINDHDHVYCRSRILTDVRPVFAESVSEPPAALVVVHTLRLSYHSARDSSGPEGFYVALDVRDLEDLKTQIDRAIDKEKTIRSLFLSKGLPVVSTSEVS